VPTAGTGRSILSSRLSESSAVSRRLATRPSTTGRRNCRASRFSLDLVPYYGAYNRTRGATP
jgi:hypothetical protein